jgi:aspartate 1-decarboxylase
MKKALLVLSLSSVLAACSSAPQAPQATQEEYNRRAQEAQVRQDHNADKAIDSAPAWMMKLPKSENAVYENGTAVSADFGMADMKARTIAYAKICTAAGGKVRSQTKIFRSDSDSSSSESSELAVRSFCPDVDITGVETVEMKHISEGGRIRTYILVALPIGKANAMATAAQIRQERTDAKARAPEAFREVDELVAPKSSSVVPQSQVKLLDVDNEEYKKKRDEALQKPGAVLGHATLQ